MKFVDAVTVSRTRETQDGYLVADARTARTGLQAYMGSEIGRPDLPTVIVYRPEDQVFARDSLASYAHKPVTNDHPDEMVSAGNWKDVAVGTVGDEITRDGEYVRVPLIVMDRATIDAVKSGKRELSAGYTCDLEFTDGTTPSGEAYQAIQKNIRINHVAIVQRGRAGSQARIGDGAFSWGISPVNIQTADERTSPMAETLRKVLVDGLQVETTDAGATAIEKLTNDKTDLAKRLTDAEKKVVDADTAHQAAIAAKDEEIGTLKADLKKAQDAAPKPADLDKMVADRVALVTVAKSIKADIVTDGLTDSAIRKAVVSAKLGEDMVKDASEAEIAGMFKAVAKDAGSSDPVRDALRTHNPNDPVSTAYSKMVADMQSAHLPKTA